MSLLQERIDNLIIKHGSYRKAAKAVDIDWAYLKRMKDGSMINPSHSVCEKLGLKKTVSIVFQMISTKQCPHINVPCSAPCKYCEDN